MRGTQLLERAVEVLKVFLPDNRPLSVAEISRRVNLSRPTVYRILVALEQQHLLMRSPHDKRFQLGPMLVYLGSVARSGFQLSQRALPVLQRLAEQSGETAHLSIRIGRVHGVFIEKVESKQSVRLHTKVGEPVPLYAGATLKVLLAHLPEEEWEAVIEAGLRRWASHTITDPAALRAHLRQIRAQGYAISREELFDGAGAVAAPVFGPDGQVVAGLGISGPVFRLTEAKVQQLIPLALAGARAIGSSLQGRAAEEVAAGMF